MASRRRPSLGGAAASPFTAGGPAVGSFAEEVLSCWILLLSVPEHTHEQEFQVRKQIRQDLARGGAKVVRGLHGLLPPFMMEEIVT